MRVILFCALAALIGCADGSAVPDDATGGAGGQAAATGGTGGHVMAMMTGTGGAQATDGGADADPPADAQAEHPITTEPCYGFPTAPDPCGGTGTGQPLTCVNLQTDHSNCGACGHVCPSSNLAACQNGVCQ